MTIFEDRLPSTDSRVLSMLYLESFHGGRHDSKPTRDVGLHFNVLSSTAISLSGTRLTYSFSASGLVSTMKEVNPPIWTLTLRQLPRSQAPDLGTKLHHLDSEKRHGFEGYSSGGDGWSCASTPSRDDPSW